MFETGGGLDEIGGVVDRCRKAARVDVALGSNDELRAAVLDLEVARAAVPAPDPRDPRPGLSVPRM